MSRFLDPSLKKKRLQYNRANLQTAFEATQRGVSVYRAARQYCVPEATLRDRTRGRVDVDSAVGSKSIFTDDEEQKLVNHITYMADIGYGYSKADIQYMANDYADSVGKSVRSKESLSNNWFYGFLRRWPNLKHVKPQKLSIYRAKSASREALDSYYKELSSVLATNNLKDKPERIYNVDETGVSSEHNPPKVICDKATMPQSITSSRGSTVTIIGAGNALGNSVPPYYVFPGARWNDEFLKDAPPGSSGEMSKTGWSNSIVFQNYMTKHFAKYVNLSEDNSRAPTLILYDGHKSHISLTLADWAKRHNVVLFVLPPHSSHITQPLDVAVFGPFKNMYSNECQAYMKRNPGLSITKYEIAQLTSTPYMKALSAENLISAFRKTGIHPFNNKAITDSQIAPSQIYSKEPDQPSEKSEESSPSLLATSQAKPTDTDNDTGNDKPVIREQQQSGFESEPNSTEVLPAPDFFQSRTITKPVVKKTKKKFVPPFLAGNLLNKVNTEILQSAAKKSKVMPEKVKSVQKATPAKHKACKSTLAAKTTKDKTTAQPGTSGTNKKGMPLDILSEDSQESEGDVAEEEKCCVCKKWEPDELRGSVFVSFVNWGKCDFCPHWTHLKTCTEVRVLRRDSVFRCPHCPPFHL